MNPLYRRYLHWLIPGLLLALTCVPPTRADDLIRSVQEELRKRNLYFGDVDGVRSQQVAAALRRYQQRKGFPATGEADDTTLHSLDLAPLVSTAAAAGTPGFGAPALPAQAPATTAAPWPDLPVLRSDRGRANVPPPDTEPADTDLDPTPTPAPKPPPAASFIRQPAAEATVRGFVEQYLKTGESNEPGAQMDFYGERVNYFDDGVVDKRHITTDTDRYNKRWPDRRFALVGPLEVAESPDHDPQKVVVNFHCQFNVKKPGHDVHGETMNTYTLQRTGPESLRIIGIQEHRIRGK